jgi:hypothetical protein
VVTRLAMSLRPELIQTALGPEQPRRLAADETEVEQPQGAFPGRAQLEIQRNDRFAGIVIEVRQMMDAFATADRNEDVAPPRLHLHPLGVHVPLRRVLDLHHARIAKPVPHRRESGRDLILRLVVLDGDRKGFRRAGRPVCQARFEGLPDEPIETDRSAISGACRFPIDWHHECRSARRQFFNEPLDEISRGVDLRRGRDRRIRVDSAGDVDSPAEKGRAGHLFVLHHGRRREGRRRDLEVIEPKRLARKRQGECRRIEARADVGIGPPGPRRRRRRRAHQAGDLSVRQLQTLQVGREKLAALGVVGPPELLHDRRPSTDRGVEDRDAVGAEEHDDPASVATQIVYALYQCVDRDLVLVVALSL